MNGVIFLLSALWAKAHLMAVGLARDPRPEGAGLFETQFCKESPSPKIIILIINWQARNNEELRITN